MNISGRRILKTTAAVVGLSALGALGSGTAFAATPADLGGAPATHGAGSVDSAGLPSPASARSSDLHTFAMPQMATHVAEPSTRYDNNYDDNSDNNSDYRDDNNSRYDGNANYDDNNYDGNYNGNYDNGYYGNGYYDNGYRRQDNGLVGGGLLGGNN